MKYKNKYLVLRDLGWNGLIVDTRDTLEEAEEIYNLDEPDIEGAAIVEGHVIKSKKFDFWFTAK